MGRFVATRRMVCIVMFDTEKVEISGGGDEANNDNDDVTVVILESMIPMKKHARIESDGFETE